MIEKHWQSSDKTREWAALYSLGALPPEEKTAFEEHLGQGCPACTADVRSFMDVAGQLAFAEKPVCPPAELRDRLLSRIKSAQPSEGVAPAGILLNKAGLLILRSAEMAWEAAPLPGVWTKTLFLDPARKYATTLVRMAPGTVYPSHRHADIEEIYVIEGDFLVEGQRMRAGDYCRAEPDSIHSQVGTESGGLFLALSSQRDELLA